MKPRIKSVIWTIRQQTTTNHNNKNKKESKKMRILLAASGTTSRGPTFTLYRSQKEERNNKKLEIYLEK